MNKTGYPSIDKDHLNNTKFSERHPIIPPLSFSDVMDLMFMKQGNHKLVDCLDLEVDVKEFQEDSMKIAKSLLELGVKKGDIVVVSMPNFYQGVPIFKACNMMGAVVTYLNPFASLKETKDYLNLYEAKVFFNCNDNSDLIKEIKRDTKVKYVISLDEQKVNSRDFDESMDATIGNRDDFSFHQIGPVGNNYRGIVRRPFTAKDEALILYTSGSTGKPKNLLFTNENLIASCIYLKNSTHVPEVTEDDRRWANVVPFMYPYGFGASVLQTMLSGREVVLCPNLNWQNIGYYYSKNANLWFGSPAHLGLSMRYVPKNQDLSSVRSYVSGGDFLSVSQSHDGIDWFKSHGADVRIFNSSGTGETLGCSTNAMNVPYRPETVGQLVLGPEYVILNPDTLEEVKYGENGVLCTRGKHVFKEYYRNPELTDSVKIEYKGKEYYKTGNIGSLDRDRYFKLVGRASRFFIVNTLNKVYCELVQSVVSNIPCVDSCVIVPKPNEERLYESKAYVVLKDGYTDSPEMAEYIINESKKTFIDSESGEAITLKEYEVPGSVTFLDKIPRTAGAEKIDYELLKRMAKEEYDNERGTHLVKQLSNKN